MPRGIDYGALAARLRDSQRKFTRRTDEAPPEGIRLAEVLDLLTSDAAPELLDALTAQADGAVRQTRDRLEAVGAASLVGAGLQTGTSDDAFLPENPFEKRLAEFFYRREALFSPRAIDEDAVPAAVVAALCSPGNRTGILTRAEAVRLGPRVAALYDNLERALADGPVGSARPASKYEDLGVTEAWRIARSRKVPSAKARMPVLDEITKNLGGPAALAGLQMASVQHLFPSTRGLYAALADNGLRVGTTGVGGKGYSTDIDTMARLSAEGFDVHEGGRPLAFREATSAEQVTLQMARAQLSSLFGGVDPRQGGPKFLLLDEGAKLISALHRYFPRYAHLCVCVEQTERGIQIIEDAQAKGEFELACPVVDMARSEAKKRWESPMIGESCVFNLEHDLEVMAPGLEQTLFADPAKRTASVFGYGAVGKAVADRLRARGFEVHVFDPDPARMAEAAADGCVAKGRADALANGRLVYGCSGRGALGPEDFEALPDGAVLANAASGNHELGLDAVELGTDPDEAKAGFRSSSSFAGHRLDLGEADDPMRHRVWQTKGGKRLLLARSGYVVNMGKDLPPEYVQLTRGLLLSSCLVAVKAEGAGFVDIPKRVQDFVVGRVQRHVGARSLLQPDFRKLQAW